MDFPATSQLLSARHEKEVASLRDLSARIGNDPLLVQASNGNTSIKLEGTLWIKSSGRWLARAMHEEMFVPLELASFRESISNTREFASTPFWESELRPSIEAPMHAVLRHKVVVHVHSINTIAWAIRLDAPARLKERLHSLHWQWIPYAPSGAPLARAIESAVSKAPETDVLVLGNHGLVVCGPDCDSAEMLLREVERRLAIPPRPSPKPDTAALASIARSSTWEFPDADSLHALGTDALTLRILKRGVLYPCQAIFLGHPLPLIPHSLLASYDAASANSENANSPFVAIEGSGVLLNRNLTMAERTTLLALVQVTQRTEESAKLRYLERHEVAGVLNMAAHSYKDTSAIAD